MIMTKKIFIITGEHSGDIHASNVVRELKAINPDVQIEGIGGENLKNAGVKLFSGHEKMNSVGMSFKILSDHLTLGKRVVDYIRNSYKPDLVLLIDYGVFNLSVAKFLKKANIKTFYYIPPQVWASRKWRLNTIKKFVDKVLCIFPFEKTMYEEKGIDVHYCGHPLISQIPPKANRDQFFEKHGLDKNKKLVSIFPGSRVFELKNLMKVFIQSAKKLQQTHGELQFVISQAPNLSDEVYNKYLVETDFKIIKGENQALLSVSDALILASGTVSLEACLYETPMLIAYRGPQLFYMLYLLVRCINRVALPNIIADKNIVNEIIQSQVCEANISKEVEKLLYDKDYRAAHIESLSHVKELLSNKNSAKEVAIELNNALI